MVIYVDFNFVGYKDFRKSITSYFFNLVGHCISWKLQLQLVVALSTTEPEYIVATEAIKEVIWLQVLLTELHLIHSKATIYTDSQSCLHLCKNPVYHERTKQIDVKYHFI